MELNKDQKDMAFQLILKRDNNTCSLCRKQFTADKLRLHIMEASHLHGVLDRAVVLCTNCLYRVVEPDPERMKILFWPLVHKKRVIEFNAQHEYKIGMLQ